MRRSSLYPWSASRSSAAWSPPLQAFSKPVISTDRAGMAAVPQTKIPRPWPLFPPASACISVGGRKDENHGRDGDGGDGWDHCLGGCTCGGRAAGNGLHGLAYTENLGSENGAKVVSSGIFAGIGVKILWNSPRQCPAEGIRNTFSNETPAHLLPGALAY